MGPLHPRRRPRRERTDRHGISTGQGTIPVILLAAHAGLRKGEIRALRCMDVELDKDRLVVRLSRYRSHTGSTKSGNERQVPLSPQLRAALLAARVHERPREE